MTTTNIFLKLDNPIQISQKLNLVLKNINDLAWKELIIEDVKNEIINRKQIINKYKFDEILKYSNKGIEYIIDRVLMIEIDDLQNSLLVIIKEIVYPTTASMKTTVYVVLRNITV